MAKNRLKTFYVVIGLLAVLVSASHFIRHTFSAVLTALVFAYLLNPFLKYLERKGFSRIVALGSIYAVNLLFFAALIFFLMPYLTDQIESLTRAVPDYVAESKDALDLWKGKLAPYYRGEEGAWLIGQLQHALDRLTGQVSQYGYRQMKGILYGVFNIILAPILVFFMLYYKEEMKCFILRYFPKTEGCQADELASRINNTLEKFIIGLLLDALLVAMLTIIALKVLDVDFAILNGLFAGFASMVPFVGPTIAVIPPAFIAYAQTGDITIIPLIILVYFVVNVIIEGNLIKPLVMRGALKLNPLAVIFAVMALGELMGFWGIVLAIPLAAVIKICAEEYKRQVIAGK